MVECSLMNVWPFATCRIFIWKKPLWFVSNGWQYGPCECSLAILLKYSAFFHQRLCDMGVPFTLPVMQRYIPSRFVLNHHKSVAHVHVVCVDAEIYQFSKPCRSHQHPQAMCCPCFSVFVIGVCVLAPKLYDLDDFYNFETQC